MDEPRRQRRSLHFEKCRFCRASKKKCEPQDRVWPGKKCNRCGELGLECSENERASGPQKPFLLPPGDTSLPDGADNERAIAVAPVINHDINDAVEQQPVPSTHAEIPAVSAPANASAGQLWTQPSLLSHAPTWPSRLASTHNALPEERATGAQSLQPPLTHSNPQAQQTSPDYTPLLLTAPHASRPPIHSLPFPPPTSQDLYRSHDLYAEKTLYDTAHVSRLHSGRKSQRASDACDQCRQLKMKCDEARPCKGCRDRGVECKYREPVRRFTDKAVADILEGISSLQSNMAIQTTQLGKLNERLTSVETTLAKGGSLLLVDDDSAQLASAPDASSAPPTSDQESHLQMMVEDEVEADPGPPVPPGEPPIPFNHTTLTGLLLEWPAIRELTKHHLEQEGIRHIGEYPIGQEQKRGSLSLYGRGEESHLSHHTDHGSFGAGDESPGMRSSSPASDFGQPLRLGSPASSFEYRGCVFGFDGNLDFTENRVWSYVESFQANILSMHPIIQPKYLQTLIRYFLNRLPRPPNQFQSPATENPGSKRKRSPDFDSYGNASTSSPARSGRPSRTSHNALVLTILALGKICQHRSSIPDAVSPSTNPPHNGYMLKNYEVIPGLEYFAYATDILGNITGAYNTMKDVYANIFASLYYGQLCRPLESYAYIHKASHKLQVIMRPSLDKLRNIRNDGTLIRRTKDNQLALAFWTCLQLESEIIAELPVPPSALLSYENDMPYPNMSLLEGCGQRVLDSFLGQLYLRNHLNSIYRMFYSPDDPNTGGGRGSKFQNVRLVEDAVSKMNWVAPGFAFSEDDPPGQDILTVRLREKYWSAQTITYRPFIRQILQFSHSIQQHPFNPSPPTRSEFRDGIIAPVIDPGTKALSDIDPEVIELAKKGIKALIEGTRSFHNLGEGRPIVTNIFGTSHAQWGNLLVLSAAFKDPVLHQFVDEKLLRNLCDKTIRLLRQSATETSSLRTDMRILEGLQRDLFPDL